MKKTSTAAKKTALCGVLAALSIALLYLGGLTPLDLSVIFLCALITIFVVIEAGEGYAWIFIFVTGALADILMPNKLFSIEYFLFGALYPILKSHIEKLPRIPSFIVKIAVLDIMLLGCLLLGKFVFLAGEDYFSLSFVTMLIGTLFFVLYDFTLTKCLSYYLAVLRKKLNIKW